MNEKYYSTKDLYICELYHVVSISKTKEMKEFKTPEYRIMKKNVQIDDNFFFVYYSDIYGNGKYDSSIHLSDAYNGKIIAQPKVSISKYGTALTLSEIEEIYDAFIFEKEINKILETENVQVLRGFKEFLQGNPTKVENYVNRIATDLDKKIQTKKK